VLLQVGGVGKSVSGARALLRCLYGGYGYIALNDTPLNQFKTKISVKAVPGSALDWLPNPVKTENSWLLRVPLSYLITR
jgi:hypothetical protein